MASVPQNVTQISTVQSTYDPTSIFYAVGSSGTVDTQLAGSVLLANTALTGIPTVPTASVATNTTQVASTAYVQSNLANYSTTTQIASTYETQANATASFAPITGSATYAPIASPTFTGTPSAPSAGTNTNSTQLATTAFVRNYLAGPIVGMGLTVAVPLSNFKGDASGGSAAAGVVGEFISSSIGTGSAVPLTTGTLTNVTSISLTAGDWDVWGTVATNPTGTTTTTFFAGAVSTTTAALPAIGSGGSFFSFPFAVAAGQGIVNGIAPTRINVSTTTTVFLVAEAVFAISTLGAYGNIQARRAR
jgi:hypothetical protein